jgi:hypothetical protein
LIAVLIGECALTELVKAPLSTYGQKRDSTVGIIQRITSVPP